MEACYWQGKNTPVVVMKSTAKLHILFQMVPCERVFLFNLFVRSYPVALQWIVSLLCPAAIFFIAEGYTHVLYKMHSGPVFLSLILYYLVFVILFLLTGNARNSIRIMTVFMILVLWNLLKVRMGLVSF